MSSESGRSKAKHSWHSPSLSARYGELPYDEPRYKPRIPDADQGMPACVIPPLASSLQTLRHVSSVVGFGVHTPGAAGTLKIQYARAEKCLSWSLHVSCNSSAISPWVPHSAARWACVSLGGMHCQRRND